MLQKYPILFALSPLAKIFKRIKMNSFVAVLLLACAVSAQIPDTPEVAAARAAHLAAHRAAQGLPPIVQQWNGVGPVPDTPEIIAAKIQFYRAYQAAAAANGVVSNLPPLAGIPVQQQGIADTPEVAAAKAQFFRAFNEAAARAAQ